MRVALLAMTVSLWELLAIGGIAIGDAGAEPMNLSNATPRAVAVRFENSPADAPARLRESFTADLPARFDVDAGTGRVRVTISGSALERGYFHRQRLRPGSFSDYVWTFEAATGHVVSASLSGVFVRRFAIGLLEQDVETPFEAELTTLRNFGFAPAHHLFGQVVFPLCDRAARDCTLVEPTRYDAATGYVNAVGAIEGRAFGVSRRSFASIGEAIFSELPPAGAYADLR